MLRRLLNAIALGLAAVLLAACGGQVVVRESFPAPIVDPLPYRVGVVYRPAFTGYVYDNRDSKVNFELGSKQTALFESVLGAMFAETVTLPDPGSAPGTDVDLVIEPVLQEYAYLAPSETATEFYAVSLRYQLRLYSGEGELIGYWPFVAYGKNRTKLLNRFESLGDATSSALRDAGAALVSQFRTVIENESWRQPEEAET